MSFKLPYDHIHYQSSVRPDWDECESSENWTVFLGLNSDGDYIAEHYDRSEPDTTIYVVVAGPYPYSYYAPSCVINDPDVPFWPSPR